MNEIPLRQDFDVFESILESKKDDIDNDRFYIKYLPSIELEKYDFNDKESLRKFRDICFTIDTPILGMGGCNLRERYMDDFRRSGKKISVLMVKYLVILILEMALLHIVHYLINFIMNMM